MSTSSKEIVGGGAPKSRVGLVVTGGGARGAYQAGVLKRVGEIRHVQTQGNPFPIIEGASAGAINGAALAAGSDDFSAATATIAGLWSAVQPTDVFRCDVLSQARNALTWIRDLSFGGIAGGGNAHSLLDASPLHHFLQKCIPCERIQANIARGNLYALAIAATNYNSGKGYLFIQGKKGHALWNRSRRITVPTTITIEHLCASAAIPLVFQPVCLEVPDAGKAFFGDGCVRLHQPLSPVIRLGADRLFAVGVRCEEYEHQNDAPDEGNPSLARVMGVLFNVIFLDHLTADVEHLERLNQLLMSGQLNPSGSGSETLRPLSTLLITPSADLSQIANAHQREMPYLIQYFVGSLGRDPESCADLMSYLMFTPSYTRTLIDIGYNDAAKRIDEIEDFLFSADPNGERAKRRSRRTA